MDTFATIFMIEEPCDVDVVRNSKYCMQIIFIKVSYSRALHVQPFVHAAFICFQQLWLDSIWYAQTITCCHARYDFKNEIQNVNMRCN